jgi:uncharacterized membrane protein YeaQ/YmgE (transglycosylase-associated protein family)
MSLLGWIILGGFAGWLASVLMHEDTGCLMNILLGVVGAVLGGAVFHLVFGIGFTGFNLWGLVVALVGAVLLLAIVQSLRRRPGPRG